MMYFAKKCYVALIKSIILTFFLSLKMDWIVEPVINKEWF